jgi:Ca-activated chloride channel family protein
MKRIFAFLTVAVSLLLSPLPQASAVTEPLVRCRIALDREVLPAGPAQTTVVKVTLEVAPLLRKTERPPVNLVLVLDRSGSMAGSKIEKAKEAAIEALHRLGPQDLFSLVAYNHQVETLIPSQSAAHIEAIEGEIRGIYADGNTALFGAVSQGAAEIRKNLHRDFVHRVILLSDGLANVGPSAPADLARLGAALLKEGISVTTIGVGTDFNEDLMTELAGRSDGNHYFVESSSDLPRIFAAELGDVLSVVARKVVIEIECPDGVRPLRIIGRQGRIRGNRVELQMNQLYGGQEKYALVEVTVPPSRPEQTLALAKVSCRYDNALTSRSESSSAEAVARFSGRAEEVRKGANRKVQEAVVENEMAVARDRALDLYNAGKPAAAALELRQKKDELQEKNEALGFSDLAGSAAGLEADAAAFEEQKLDSPAKKALRSESYKVRSQQRDY